MIRLKTQRNLLLVGVLALALGGFATAYGQYTITGNTPGGGNIVVGNGPALGALGPGAPLSPGGNDQVTIEPGAIVTGATGITFGTSGDTLINLGTIISTGNDGVDFFAGNIANEITNNYGSITGASGGNGTGILFYANTTSGLVAGNTVNNWGSISGGSGGAGMGIWLDAAGAMGIVTNNTVNNWGLITGVNTFSACVYLSGYNDTGNTVNNWGAINAPGGGITMESGNFVSNNIVNNWGAINALNTGGVGIAFVPLNAAVGNTVNNWGAINVGATHAYGVYLNSSTVSANTVNNRGGISAGAGSVGVYLEGDTVSGNTVNNWNGISAGGGGSAAGIFLQGGAVSGNIVNNWGVVNAGAGGAGVYLDGDTVPFGNSGNTVNNWGAISAGSGGNAIFIVNGSNNTVNLNGHSSVNGKISISGAVNSNTVNLNFTGVSPATINALKPLLLAQGVNSGVDTPSVTFTLRGVTYTIDPAIVNFNLSSYQLQGFTPNQAAIGASLDSLTYNPAPGTPLANMLNAIDQSGNVPGALDELSPQAYALYGDLAIQNSDFLVTSLDARLNNLRDGSESIAATGLGAQASIDGGPDESIAGWTKNDGKETKEVQTPAPQPRRWGFFAEGDGLFLRGNYHDIDARQNGKADTAGTIAGVDALAGDHGALGAFFAYNNSAAQLDGNGSRAQVESYSGGLYGAFHEDGFYLNGLAAYTRNDYNSNRNVLFPGFAASANGSTNSDQATVNLDGGYDWNATDRLSVGPLVGLQYVYLNIDGFNEGSGGGPAALAVGGQNLNSMQSRAGVHANYHVATSNVSALALDLHASWQHEYLDDSRSIGATFENGGFAPFAVQTASPRRDAAVVGLEFNATFHDRLTLFMGYDLDISSASYFEQSVNGGARISF